MDYGESVCVKCDYKCLSCVTTPTTCTLCDRRLFRFLNNTNCDCNLGYFETGVPKCGVCDYTCRTCVTVETYCTSCDPTLFRFSEPIDNSCPCIDGYFDDGYSYSC